MIDHLTCDHTEVFFHSHTTVSFSEVFFRCLLMHRFVSKRSSSSVDLASSSAASSLDDVRTEEAAIALSVGLSWPPVNRQRSARSIWQHLWECLLQEHVFHHHELPHGVRLQRPSLWRPGETTARPLTHEEVAFTSTPCAALAALATPAAALVEDEPSGSSSKRHKIHADPIVRDGTSGGQNSEGACSGACARSSGCAQGCST